ncbi:helix-turn-helix domain-containing protein [Alishewanella tabrizica]|uniref:Transcriptional regulator n=1 Tax=Alishewanella tabrizica TaxID=671278 RepID=A0ABQ2WMT6_9ALTE|nr:helix-turn-helix transcriptional regulator [Alishewanella tabrizica]GGW61447.1 transcriptional regulator [Alishewanella tabrizica]
MIEISIVIGAKIREKRHLAKISQDNLALHADVDRSYLGRIERGEANITVSMLYRIAMVLDCDAKELLP